MKKMIFINLFILLTIIVSGTKKVPLKGILPPEILTVDKTQLYVSNGTNVSIFALPELKLIKNFGKKGEGPGEFISIGDDNSLRLDVQSNKICITSRNKISYFTKDGKFLNEIRVKNGFFHKPVGENFIGLRNTVINKIVYLNVTLYDKNFKIIKYLFKKKAWFQQGKSINPITVRPPVFCAYKDLIFTKDGKGNINIFNNKGDLVNTTSVNFKYQKITEQNKKEYHDYYRTHPIYKQAYGQLKSLIKFPENFPKIKIFDVSDSFLYVFTYIKKRNKSELYIFDLNGKLKKKIYVDMPELDPQDVFPIIKVRNKKIYQVVENEEDEEEVDLSITDIKI